LIGFLCELSQSDAIERLAVFRGEAVVGAYYEFRKAVKRFDGVAFGSNAYSPIGARICGHDYEAFAETCEFVQPLLGYMEWHRFEPIAAWGRCLMKYARLDEASAVEAAKRLFYLGGAACPDSIAELDTCGEGNDRTVRAMVGRELELCTRYLSKPYQLLPVLRGIDWGKTVTDSLMEEVKRHQFTAVIFMGCEYLIAGEPSEGWF
jgi:hypothetical protein